MEMETGIIRKTQHGIDYKLIKKKKILKSLGKLPVFLMIAKNL